MHKRFRVLRALSLTGFAVLSTLLPLALAQENVRASLRSESDRKSAPELALEDSSGKPVTLKDYQGKVVLLDFWATWCHGCKEEIPWFSEFERPSPAPDLIPAETKNQPRTHIGIGTANGGTSEESF